MNTGTVRPRNGPVVTAGGLVFIANSQDRMLRAYDNDTTAACSGSTSSRRIPKASRRSMRSAAASTSRLPPARRGAPAAIRCGGTRFHRKQGEIEAQGYHVFRAAVASREGTSTIEIHDRNCIRAARSDWLAAAVRRRAGRWPRSHRRADAGVRARARRARARHVAHAHAGRRRAADELEARDSRETACTFLDAVVRADAAVVDFVEGSSTQRVSPQLPKTLDHNAHGRGDRRDPRRGWVRCGC